MSMALPAWTMLIYWLVLQLLGGATAMAGSRGGGGVAFWAHIGGFVAGLVLIKLFARREYVDAHRATSYRPSRLRGAA
jgi:membrane associated rhomboid family serine protease